MKQFSQSGLMKRRGKDCCNKSARQSGYILLMMMLFIALMAVAALAALPSMEMQVKRDREEEMIHRGAQYARAIRHYVKKFGRYPTSIADLQDTNDVHFLRKAYKDPITGKDFRLLHMGDLQMLMGGAGFNGGGGNPAAAAGAGQPGMPAGVPISSGGDARSGTVVQPDGSGNSSGNNNGDNSSAGSSGNDQSSDASSPNGSSPNGSSSNGPSGQVFGGGPIMGVASASKDKTIRKFNNKEHYNEWLFVYDPTNDRALITGPYQPTLMGQGIGQPIGAANGAGVQNTPGFGNQMNQGQGMQPMQPQNPGTSPFQH